MPTVCTTPAFSGPSSTSNQYRHRQRVWRQKRKGPTCEGTRAHGAQSPECARPGRTTRCAKWLKHTGWPADRLPVDSASTSRRPHVPDVHQPTGIHAPEDNAPTSRCPRVPDVHQPAGIHASDAVSLGLRTGMCAHTATQVTTVYAIVMAKQVVLPTQPAGFLARVRRSCNGGQTSIRHKSAKVVLQVSTQTAVMPTAIAQMVAVPIH